MPQSRAHTSVWVLEEEEFAFSLEVASHVRFNCEYDPVLSVQYVFSLTRYEGDDITGGLYCYSAVSLIQSVNHQNYGSVEPFEQFAAQWMLVFRRNCWLSGLPIEASAHEKMEWTREFTKEVMEAWNLKM